MKLITALGNPGKKYQTTRHNTGFLLIDLLREKFLFQTNLTVTEWEEEKTFMSELSFLKKGSQIIAVFQKPMTYMNNSGIAVAKIVKKYGIENLQENFLLLHDDLDLKLGNYKIQQGKAPQGHNGVKDVEGCLKTTQFKRVRVGIESRSDKNIPGEDFVLMKFTQDERMILNEVMEDIVKVLLPEILL